MVVWLFDSVVTRTFGEVIIIGLIILSQVKNFPFFKLAYAVQHHWLPMVVFCFIMSGKTYLADVFPALSCVICWHLIFGEYGLEWALWYTGSTIDAGVWIDVVPGPLFLRDTGDDTFDWTHVHTARISQTKTSNDIRHGKDLLGMMVFFFDWFKSPVDSYQFSPTVLAVKIVVPTLTFVK
jgi:hypothetical protein